MGDPIAALTADRRAVLEVCQDLGEGEWTAPSGCAGWSVQDVVAHLCAGFWTVVDPASLPDLSRQSFEEAQEVLVAARRQLRPDQVLDDYAEVSEKALAVLAGLAELPDDALEVPLGDVGTYPARLIPSAFAFDHYTHLRADLFAPRGRLVGPPPPPDAVRLDAVLDWIEAALPQQNRDLVDGLSGAVDVQSTGVVTRTLRLGAAAGPSVATLASDADALVWWITRRGTWEDHGVRAEGDPTTLERLRDLRVF